MVDTAIQFTFRGLHKCKTRAIYTFVASVLCVDSSILSGISASWRPLRHPALSAIVVKCLGRLLASLFWLHLLETRRSWVFVYDSRPLSHLVYQLYMVIRVPFILSSLYYGCISLSILQNATTLLLGRLLLSCHPLACQLRGDSKTQLNIWALSRIGPSHLLFISERLPPKQDTYCLWYGGFLFNFPDPHLPTLCNTLVRRHLKCSPNLIANVSFSERIQR